MEVTRAERLAAWFALALIVALLVIDVDVITGGRLLGGFGGDVDDQAVSEDGPATGDGGD